MENTGLDIINSMAKKTQKEKISVPQEKETQKKEVFSFKKEKVRKVYKGSHLPEWLADKVECKARSEGISESFLMQKILESWFEKYE